jgi:hypothetical protein
MSEVGFPKNFRDMAECNPRKIVAHPHKGVRI